MALQKVEDIFPPADWMMNYEDDDEEETDDDEEYDHHYDDYEDLFSNETMSQQEEEDGAQDVGMYLQTDPALQREVGQLIMLQRYLDSLQEKMSEKNFAVLKCREELVASRTRSNALNEELAQVTGELATARDQENVASCQRLERKKAKLETEIENEVKVELEVAKNLREAELELNKTELEQKHYADLAGQVAEKEELIKKHKEKMAEYRLNKHEKTIKLNNRKYKIAEKDMKEEVETRKATHERIADSAIINHEKATLKLKETLTKIYEKETKEEATRQGEVDQRVRNIVGLKNSIAQSRDNLKALQARDAARKKKKKVAKKQEYQRILDEGGNPDFFMMRQKKIAQKEQEKIDLAARQKVNKATIVANILNEEDNLKMRKHQQPWLFGEKIKTKKVAKMPKPPVHDKIQLTDDYEPVYLKHARYNRPSKQEEFRIVESDDSSSDSDTPQSNSVPALRKSRRSNEKDEQVVTQPEFEGLWDQSQKTYKPADDRPSVKSKGRTIMEQDILEKVLSKHRQNIVKKQIAGGREFKGQPFYSKPDVIHFKNLEVGKVYKKKVLITNVSYSINFLRLTGLSEHLKDFIKIDFNAPGQMSAGMSCEMLVTFKPMINEDLEGEALFLAQTGPFSIPLKCSTKRCDLSVDVEAINFGTQVVGETIRRSVTLTNRGALGTRFEFTKVPDQPITSYSMATSLGRLTTAETSRYLANESTEPDRTIETTTQRDTARKSKRPIPSTANTGDAVSCAPVSTAHGRAATADTLADIPETMPVQVVEDYEGAEEEMDFTSPTTEYNEVIPDELKVGDIMSGEIEAFSSVRLDIVFSPSIPGDIQATFLVSFAHQTSKPIEIKVSAVAIDVPVWLERQVSQISIYQKLSKKTEAISSSMLDVSAGFIQNVDLKICMYDRLYQEQIHVQNRSSTALRLHFEVPKELQDHIELLPKTGFVQAKSKFVAQLKFLPRLSLAEDASGLFDPETGVLEAPMVVRVADQTRPVPFVVNAVITSSDLEFDQTTIDFGHCSVCESVVHTVKLTNRSILPQLYGFVGIPDFIDIQPNDGFGKILPLETIELDVILSAKQAKEYDFTLTCKSGINRDFRITCKAVGALPPLELSHQVLHFAATPLDDVSTSLIYVVNSHTSANEFTHPVPRIGKGDIVPVGPTSFEFVIPKDAPISIHPMVGTVNPGEKCHVTLEFCPTLEEAKVREEACKVAEQMREDEKKKEEERLKKEAEEAEAKQLEEEKMQKRKKTPKTPARSKGAAETPHKSQKGSAKVVKKTPEPVPTTPESIDKNLFQSSKEYRSAYSSLTRNFGGSFQSSTISCFVAPGACSVSEAPSSLPFNVANTLHLEVHCPAIKPPVVVISNYGHRALDFGPISIGQNAVKPFSIQNISNQPIELTISMLDTSGPFLMLNALRTLLPLETHTVLVSFTPTVGKISQEVLSVRGPTSSLDVHLTGQGVTPDLRVDLENNKLDFGHVLQEETTTASFNIENRSLLTLKYAIHMDSTSLLLHEDRQQLPNYITKSNDARKSLAGTQNRKGLCVFDCVPCAGELKTNEKQEIQVTFKPDHESRRFSDAARFILFNSEKSHLIHLTGIAHAQTMYVAGDDPLDVSEESLALDACDLDEEPPSVTKKTIYLSFRSHVTPNGFKTVTRRLTIGCVKSSNAAKKASEWTVEQTNALTGNGFTIDPLKSTVDAESTKPLIFTWTPPENHDPSVAIHASVNMTLKSEVTTIYKIILSGLIAFN